MNMKEMMAYTFPAKTFEDWQLKAEQSLKGKSADTLQTDTYEQIKLKPLYIQNDEKDAGMPGIPDYRRGSHLQGYREVKWHVAQLVPWKTTEELSKKLAGGFSKGQSAIAFELNNGDVKELAKASVPFAKENPFAIHASARQKEFIDSLEEESGNGVLTGYIASDPLSLFAKDGTMPDGGFEGWARFIAETAQNQPELRTVLADTGAYHNNGANAVEELAAAAGTGVFYINLLLDAGMGVEDIFAKMVFKFPIGANFFMEIAKLRAARIIWNKIGEAYGVEEPFRGMVTAAETSQFTKTVFDPHVNLLRAGNEAFAAVLGGVHYLHVEPFDALTGSTPFSERIARNIQLILREEVHLDKVADPAGGSWYVEELTEQLAASAWELFGKIDSSGGMFAALQSGWFQKGISETLSNRFADIKSRKQSIIGTNVYANLDEAAPFLKQADGDTKTRLATPFEELRLKAATIAESGKKTEIGLICLGSLKDSKARADFIEGFLAPGGIKAVRSGQVFGTDEASAFVKETGLKRFCLCSSNGIYQEAGFGILKDLKARYPEHVFYLAGIPEEKGEWEKAGVKEFITVKTNCHGFLATVIDEMEAKE